MNGFQILSPQAIERELLVITRRWQATHHEHEAFRSWAWVVASVCETYANENRAACAELLKDETASLRRLIADRQRQVNSISEELVSRRAFLSFLESQVDAKHAAA